MNLPLQHSEVEPSFFFHQHSFVFRNPEIEIVSFSCQQATIYFVHRDDELVSLDRSSFGGPIISATTEPSDLTGLLKKINTWSLEHAITAIQVRCFPETYNTFQSELINAAFLHAEYQIQYTDIDQVLFVSDRKINMSISPRMHVKKCQKLGFDFLPLDPAALGKAYDLIADSRQRKKYPMSMTLIDLAEMFKRFPENYLLFGVHHNATLIASTVVIVVSPLIWYCFYLGDDQKFRTYSPITFLIYHLYDYAQKRGVTLLDLGTSSDKGVVNPGVYSFKKSLGCEVANRHTFVKKL